jgi:hypothetical protein
MAHGLLGMQSTAARTSRICLIVYLVWFVLSAFLASVPGDYWQWYTIMAALAVVPVLVGPARYRLWGIVALVLAALLIVGDIYAGKHFRERFHRISADSTK